MPSRFPKQVSPGFSKLFIFFILLLQANGSRAQAGTKYFARLGNLDSVNIPAKVIKAQNGIFVFEVMRVNHWEPLDVDGFTMMIMRSDSVIAKIRNKGGRFEMEVKEAIDLSKKGDIILFFKIVGRKYDRSKIPVFPLEFMVE